MGVNTFYDESYAMLRAQILDGSLKPGTRLVQEDIARQFGLSRVPLREAIRKLEGERLVVVVPRRGVTVPDLSDEDLTDLYLIRCQLEPLGFRRAAEAATDENIADMQDRTEQLAALTGSPREFFQAHDELVRWTLLLGQSPIYADVVTMLRERSQYLRYAYCLLPGQTDKLLASRRAVTEAFAQRRVDFVEQLSHTQLIDGRDALLNWRAEGRATTPEGEN